MPSLIREQLSSITQQIKLVSHELDTKYELRRNSSDATTPALNKSISKLSILKKRLRHESDSIIELLLSDADSNEFKIDQQRRSILNQSESVRVAIENKNLKKQRGIDSKVRLSCERAALRNVWSENTFPLFLALKELSEDDPNYIEKSKYLAWLGIYSRALLTHRVRGDRDLLDSLAEPTFNDRVIAELSISLDDVNSMIDKIVNQTDLAFSEYEALVESRY